MILVPLFDLKFLTELAAGGAGTSNRRHQCNGSDVRTSSPGYTRLDAKARQLSLLRRRFGGAVQTLAHFLAGLEERHRFLLNRDMGAGARIAAHARGAI